MLARIAVLLNALAILCIWATPEPDAVSPGLIIPCSLGLFYSLAQLSPK